MSQASGIGTHVHFHLTRQKCKNEKVVGKCRVQSCTLSQNQIQSPTSHFPAHFTAVTARRVHSFVCICTDYGLHNTICKHIHAVNTKLNAALHTHSVTSGMTEDEVAFGAAEIAVHLSTMKPRTDRSKRRQEALNAVDQLRCLLEQTDPQSNASIAETVITGVNKIINTVNAMSGITATSFQTAEGTAPSEPWNKLSETQSRFHSTKASRKRGHAETQVKKPTTEEKRHITAALGGNVPIINRDRACDDHTYEPVHSTFNFVHSYIKPQ